MTFGYGIKYILPNNNEESPTLTGRTFLLLNYAFNKIKISMLL